MGNVSLKVLEKSLNFLFKNGYKPCNNQSITLCISLNFSGSFKLNS